MKTKIIILMFFSFLEMSLLSQNWQHIGPIKDNNAANHFESGRADCVMPDNGYNGTTNKTIYIGSKPGGLWYTTNLGGSWTPWPTPNSIKYHGVSALEMRPSSSKNMFVATYNQPNQAPGDNIFILHTVANTWTPTDMNTVSPGCTVNDIAIFPGDTTVVFAATNTGLYYSSNSGLNWSLKRTGNFEKVDFVNVTSATGGYKVFVCGENDIAFSSNKGSSFTQHAALMTAFGAAFYADMAVTADPSGNQLLYFDGLIGSNHNIKRLTVVPSTGVETLASAGSLSDLAPSTDRMCVTASNQMVYFGSGGVAKYSFGTSTFYTPPASGADYATSSVSYGNFTGNTHSDLHEMLLIPSVNQLFVVCDGGFYYDTYTPNSNGTCGNTWTTANNQLNISQILGLSCSESDPDKYFTGEQDTKAFLVSGAANTTNGYGTEPSNIIIDRNNDNNYLYSLSTSSQTLYGVFNSTSIVTPTLTYWENPTGTFCNPANNYQFPGAEFGSSTLYQDPNRPSRGIYYGIKAGVLQEYCPSINKFMLKAGMPGATWEQYVSSITFSKANKDKVYATINNRNFFLPGYTDTAMAKLYAYTGTNFDDSWAGHNDSWVNVSPGMTDPVFTTPLSYPSAYQVEYPGVVVSDWDPNLIYLGIRNVPGNAGLKVLKRSGGVWSDYSTGIPAGEFVVSIIYEQGTDDQIYVGTNVNVYYRNNALSTWMPFSGILPNVTMQQLRINYTENTLRAGTFGRGMWKSDLSCPAATTQILSGITVVTNTFKEASNYISAQNYTITNGSVKFRAGEYIDLLPDFLVTANSTTDFFAFIHGCTGPGNTFRAAHTDDEDYSDLSMEEIEERYEKQQESKFTVYPNPSSGIFNIDFKIGEDKSGRILIKDIVGKEIKIIFISGEQHDCEANLDTYKAGIYFVSLYEGDQLIETKKIVINH
jgi:hypothetical protein